MPSRSGSEGRNERECQLRVSYRVPFPSQPMSKLRSKNYVLYWNGGYIHGVMASFIAEESVATSN